MFSLYTLGCLLSGALAAAPPALITPPVRPTTAIASSSLPRRPGAAVNALGRKSQLRGWPRVKVVGYVGLRQEENTNTLVDMANGDVPKTVQDSRATSSVPPERARAASSDSGRSWAETAPVEVWRTSLFARLLAVFFVAAAVRQWRRTLAKQAPAAESAETEMTGLGCGGGGGGFLAPAQEKLAVAAFSSETVEPGCLPPSSGNDSRSEHSIAFAGGQCLPPRSRPTMLRYGFRETLSAQNPREGLVRRFFGLLGSTKRALKLVWASGRSLTLVLGVLTLVMGLLPGVRAALTKQVVDAVVDSMTLNSSRPAFVWLGFEAIVVVALFAARRAYTVAESFLGTLLGHRVNVMILDKAQELQLTDFEDSAIYDKLTRARREASSRPLSLAKQSLDMIRNVLSLLTYGALLFGFSSAAVLVLLVTALPPFFAGVKFAGDVFQLARRQTSGFREQIYLERVMATVEPAKEVKLFGLGPWLQDRYCRIFDKFFKETSSLARRQGVLGFLLDLVSILGLYSAYAWVVAAAALGRISLGDMTMYFLIFKEGQQAFAAVLKAIGGMYADNLYLTNLYEFLDYKANVSTGTGLAGPEPGDGVRFENVCFRYPGASEDTIKGVTFHIRPGSRFALVGSNGAGKTTLIKLLTGLYRPSSGCIRLDGLELDRWEPVALRTRISAIFQDFVRYELTVGANVGVGDIAAVAEEPRLSAAATRGMAAPFIEEWPEKYRTQLGHMFMRGRELSGGQWQKVALSRALMREGPDIVVLDEPTAAMDAEAEAMIFERLASLTAQQSALLISHRFSTVRMADEIAVLEDGKISEQGSHEELLDMHGTYERLFRLQAKGYQ